MKDAREEEDDERSERREGVREEGGVEGEGGGEEGVPAVRLRERGGKGERRSDAWRGGTKGKGRRGTGPEVMDAGDEADQNVMSFGLVLKKRRDEEED